MEKDDVYEVRELLSRRGWPKNAPIDEADKELVQAEEQARCESEEDPWGDGVPFLD